VRVLLLGGTGTAGRSTLPCLLAAGHAVTAIARGEPGDRLQGAAVVRADLTDPGQLRALVRGHEAVIDHRVALPATSRAALPGAWKDYVYLRDQATGELVDAMLDEGVDRLVRDLVSLIYADGGDAWLNEDSPVDAGGPLAANLAAEAHVARLPDGVVLRCGLFYGGRDAMTEETVRLARRGAALVVGFGDAWHSALHTSDVGPAVVASLAVPGGVYNVVDDDPLRRAHLLALLAECAGREALRRPPRWLLAGSAAGRLQVRSQRVSAERFRDLTGWKPAVPSRRTGWPQAFGYAQS
jgi:nucleoside-diphosphate-sugar epimerase